MGEIENKTPVMDSPTKITRNEFGLLTHINYVYNDDNYINWKAMIPSKFLYVNPSPKKREKLEKKYGKPINQIDPIADKVEDCDLVQLLGAAKYLLKIRGYTSITYRVVTSDNHYASVSCSIEFIPNFETGMKPVIYSDNACAHVNNTTSFTKEYLVEMATNRAFVRTVRNFLGIDIVNKEELGASDDTQETVNSSSVEPHTILDAKLKEKGVDFEKLKNKLLIKSTKENDVNYGEKINSWKTLKDIPKSEVFRILTFMAEKEAQ